MKKAFTIVELLVVVGIIGILTGALLVAFGGATESARAAKCQGNLRTLAQACYSAALKDDYRRYPHAGSTWYADLSSKQIHYKQHKGWISWLCGNTFKSAPTSKGSIPYAGCLASERDTTFAVTNGAIWQAVGANSSCYICPTLVRKDKLKRMAWSYAMNGAFCYGSDKVEAPWSGKRIGSMARAEKTLLFAEICEEDLGGGGNGDYTADCVLEYGSPKGAETERIGFNHSYKKDSYAHVAFADGHVERLKRLPGTDEKEFTKWLCLGYDITIEGGKKYKVDKSGVSGED